MRTLGQTSTTPLVPRPLALLVIALAAAVLALAGAVRPAMADGEGTFSFDASSYAVDEGGVATLTVVRTGGTGAINIDYNVNNPQDAPIGVSGGTVEFGDGQDEKDITIATFADANDVSEQFTVALIDPPGDASIGAPGIATVTVTEPQTFNLETDAYDVIEGETVTVTVLRTGNTDGSATVEVEVTGGTAAAPANFVAPGVIELDFAPGETEETFEIDTTNDAADTGPLTIVLGITGTDTGIIGDDDETTITIIDVAHGVLEFDAATYEVAEDGTSIDITVTRSGGDIGEVTVTCATVAGGTATAGADYTTVDDELTFDAEETEATCTVPVTDDALIEGDETVFLELQDPTGGALLGAQSTATLTIEDDEVAPELDFSEATFSVVEGDLIATITVERSGDTSGESTVTWVAGEGGSPPATGDVDFELATGELTFDEGVTSLTFEVTIIDDDLLEENEVLALALTDPVGATLGDNDTALLTIVDDDGAPDTITYTLYFRWSLYSWAGEDGADILDLLTTPGEGSSENMDEKLTAMWYWDSAAQAWSSWFLQAEVENIPGLNDFETLTYGHAYWMAVNTEGSHDWVVPAGP